jgi:hypothetical protein
VNRPRNVGHVYVSYAYISFSLLGAEERRIFRQSQAKPVCDALHEWMTAQRKLVSEGSAIAKALDYSLRGLGGAHALSRRRARAYR